MRPVSVSMEGTVRAGVSALRPVKQDPVSHALREALGDDLFAAARELANLVGPRAKPAAADLELRATVLALAGACLWAARSGSTRLPLGSPREGPLHDVLEELKVPAAVAGRVFALVRAAPVGGPAATVLGRVGEFKPLIHAGDAVCIHRLVEQEQALGARLRERLAAAPAGCDVAKVGAALRDVLERAPRFRGAPVALSDEQQRAMLAAAHQRLTVISGGPGTGKTSIVVSILRLLARLGTKLEDVALAAPTGKAANRMEEAIAGYLRSIAAPSKEDEELLAHRPAPMTLHRLLGYSPHSDRFKHHDQNRLPHAVVIVDEASMIDLALMDQLVKSVTAGAQLVLLGDAEQLPSVEAGAVLRDLVPAAPARPPRAWDPLVTGADGAGSAGSGPSSDLRDLAAVRLTKSYRMDEQDPSGRSIYLVSQQVRSGAVPPAGQAGDRAPHLLVRSQAAEVSWEQVELLGGDEAGRAAFLERWFRERVSSLPGFPARVRHTYVETVTGFGAADTENLEALDGHLQKARLLCLTRSGHRPSGAGHVNQVLRELLREATEEPGRPRPGALAPGMPVLMRRNDYELGLFNGDQGLAVSVRRSGEEQGTLRLVFRVRGEYRVFDAGALGDQVEPCWAMTVHKAQGSEFEHVALLLPTEAEREQGGDAEALACREVVYTALTRARRSVTVLGTEAALKAAVGRSLERWSALGAVAYWGA